MRRLVLPWRMRAWLIDQLTGIDRLRLAETPSPTPEPGQVVLQLRYAALNPADYYLAQNQYPARPKLPHILGRDGMGTVLRVGQGVQSIREGDRRSILRGAVGGDRPGTFAQQVSVSAESLVEIPAGWSDLEAAGATLVYLTAYQALTMWGPVPDKAVVLVTGASGGVGVATVQLARALGWTVLGLSRSEAKSARLREMGASATFNPESRDWTREAKAWMGDRRIDLAVDNIGGALLPQVISLLGNQGRVSLVGRLAGPVPEFNTATLFFRRLRMGGVAVGEYTNVEAHAAWREVLRLLARTGARPLVDRVFPFEQLPLAFARLTQGPMGKVLLEVPPGS